jgi:hypothetical protein
MSRHRDGISEKRTAHLNHVASAGHVSVLPRCPYAAISAARTTGPGHGIASTNQSALQITEAGRYG